MLAALARVRPFALSCLMLAALAGCQNDEEESASPVGPEVEPELGLLDWRPVRAGPFRVYTQNVYLGGDTGPLFNGLDFDDIPAVLAATNQFWGEVQASDAEGRVEEIVNEISRRRPHVVSLQEVLRFVLLDGNFQPTGGLDLLAMLEAELASRGLHYETEVVQEATSSTLPLGVDFSTGQITQLLNFTDRIAILRHSNVEAVASAQGEYAATFTLGPVVLRRGWGRVTVSHRGEQHHVVGTHLEIQALAPIHSAQADELENVVAAGLEGVTIIAGDLNSDAEAAPGDPSYTPTYGNLLDAGFLDVWEESRASRRRPGYTCCQDPSLREASQLDERIDFVLARSSQPHVAEEDDGHDGGSDISRPGGFFRADIVGESRRDRTDSGLWPSDHAGVYATIRFFRGKRHD